VAALHGLLEKVHERRFVARGADVGSEVKPVLEPFQEPVTELRVAADGVVAAAGRKVAAQVGVLLH